MDSKAIDLRFQMKYILYPLCMLFDFVRFLLKVHTILFEIFLSYRDYQLQIDEGQYKSSAIPLRTLWHYYRTSAPSNEVYMTLFYFKGLKS